MIYKTIKFAIFLLALLFMLPFISHGQEKKFSFEMGLNHSLAANKIKYYQSDIYYDNDYKLGVYFEGRYRLTAPLNTSLLLEYSTLTRSLKFRSLGLIPSINYNLNNDGFVKPFLGIGAGVSFNNLEGVFNDDFQTNFCLMPSAGVRLFNHFTLGANYKLINKDYSHMTLRLGIYF